MSRDVVLVDWRHDLINHATRTLIMDNLTETDCLIDDFYKAAEP